MKCLGAERDRRKETFQFATNCQCVFHKMHTHTCVCVCYHESFVLLSMNQNQASFLMITSLRPNLVLWIFSQVSSASAPDLHRHRALLDMVSFKGQSLRDRDRGVSNLRKVEGGEDFEFSGALTLTPFYRGSIENPQGVGQKSKLSSGNFGGKFPPSSVRYVLTPSYPNLRISEVLGYCEAAHVKVCLSPSLHIKLSTSRPAKEHVCLCRACRGAAMKFSPETMYGSRHGTWRAISGEILLSLFPQETKLESAQNSSRQDSRHLSPDTLEL